MRKRAGQLGRCNRAIEERRDEARAARLAERAGPRMERGPVAQPLEISGPAFEPGGEAIESGSRQRLRPERAPQMKVEMRSEEHTSELQSLMRISYAVFCLKKKKKHKYNKHEQ